MDLRQLKSIIKEFEDSSVHKLEITEKDFTVKLEKRDSSQPIQYVTQKEEKFPGNIVIETKHIEIEENNYIKVKAPLVGTFYSKPSPDSSSFVGLNQHVNKGDVLFIIEAMKVMNEITSPVSGVVRKISVKNSDMVEFGQIVMEIEE